jgi:hypothetical protein
MNLPWRQTIAFWWSFFWRHLLYATPCVILLGLTAGSVADVFDRPELHASFAFLGGQVAWLPVSLIALKHALSKHASVLALSPDKQTWRLTLSIWWGFAWRASLYGVVIGFGLGILVLVIVGRPSEHPGHLTFAWLIMIPFTVIALRQSISKCSKLNGIPPTNQSSDLTTPAECEESRDERMKRRFEARKY